MTSVKHQVRFVIEIGTEIWLQLCVRLAKCIHYFPGCTCKTDMSLQRRYKHVTKHCKLSHETCHDFGQFC